MKRVLERGRELLVNIEALEQLGEYSLVTGHWTLLMKNTKQPELCGRQEQKTNGV